MYVYIYTSVYIYIYICIYKIICTYIHIIYIHMNMYIYIYMCIHTQVYIYIYMIFFTYASGSWMIHVAEYWILGCWFWRWYPSAFLGWFFNVFFPPWEIHHWNPFRKWVCHSLSRDEVPQGPKRFKHIRSSWFVLNCHKLFNPQWKSHGFYMYSHAYRNTMIDLWSLSTYHYFRIGFDLFIDLFPVSFWRVAIYIYPLVMTN